MHDEQRGTANPAARTIAHEWSCPLDEMCACTAGPEPGSLAAIDDLESTNRLLIRLLRGTPNTGALLRVARSGVAVARRARWHHPDVAEQRRVRSLYRARRGRS